MHIAAGAKAGDAGLIIVTDAMATAGSDIQAFTLNGRTIHRRNGRLTLADGTLAGADVDMVTSIRTLVRDAAVPLERALAMATSLPAKAIGRPELGRFAPGSNALPIAVRNLEAVERLTA
jgi:N-acetylglucosamine-6-phosphate deacetylase